ncbi:MAG: hypothetical protein K8R92_06005 [Planctomycetes bacterium]|nr:hypothetical protein [Planctomycetota bacterium]
MKIALVAPIMICTAALLADIVVDGTRDADYGNAKAVQNVHTGFGNATDGVNSYANGSELDAGFIKIDSDNGYLYLFLSGNLESNFNKLEVFIDSIPGEGQNVLRSDNADVDFNGLNKMGEDTVNAIQGLKFDEGFAPDFYLTTTLGGDPITQYANIAQLLTAGGGVGAYIGSGPFAGPDANNLLDDTVYGCQLSINNSNVLGVNGDSDAVYGGCGVNTGIEMKIPLVLLGWDGSSDIRICAFINGGGHDYASNQFLGTLPVGAGNLGGDGVGGYVGGFPAALRVDLANMPYPQNFSALSSDFCEACFGDMDGSGEVDGGDIGLVLLDFGPCPGCSTDLDGSGEVDGGDIGLVLLSFGACP